MESSEVRDLISSSFGLSVVYIVYTDMYMIPPLSHTHMHTYNNNEKEKNGTHMRN